MSLEQLLIDWIPTWVILSIITIGLLSWYRIRTGYKKEQMKAVGKEKKKGETFEGAIDSLLSSAPKNLKTIESEIETLKAKGATPDMLKRLESERDMLTYAVKYGDLAKPLIKPFGGLFTKILNSIGGQ